MNTPDPDIHTVAEQFAQWRATRPNNRTKVPEWLRQQALALKQRHRTGEILQALQLSSSMLSSWRKKVTPGAESSSFVPLPSPDQPRPKQQAWLDVTLDCGQGIALSSRMPPEQLAVLVVALRDQGRSPR